MHPWDRQVELIRTRADELEKELKKRNVKELYWSWSSICGGGRAILYWDNNKNVWVYESSGTNRCGDGISIPTRWHHRFEGRTLFELVYQMYDPAALLSMITTKLHVYYDP